MGDRAISEVRKSSNGATIVSTSNEYDSFGRLWKVTDGRGTTTLAYHSTDALHTVTTPDPGTGAQVTSYGYNDRGAVTSMTHPDNTTTYRLYWPDGSVKHVWGSRAYPEYRAYDRQGRLKTLTTWQSYNPSSHSGTGEAVTTWNYHGQRGWLENKRYPNDLGPTYAYTAAGRPFTRTWVRTIGGQPHVATYGQNEAGELDSIDYSDTTPDVTHVYDRAGRPQSTTDAAGTLTRNYDSASGQLASEAYSGAGLLSGRTIARTFDSKHRLQSLATNTGYGIGYDYDEAGRLETISEGFHLAKYGYKPNVGTVETVTIKRAGVERVRHQRITDALGRITQVKTTTGATIPVQRDYGYNSANQRSRIDHEDTRLWSYGYDGLGQVNSAQKRLADNTTPLPGYTFGYDFDDIGNREETTVNARTATYAPNQLNQYESRTVPGALDVRGEAHATATVTVNGGNTTRTDKDFYREVSATNTSAPVNATLSILGTESGQTATEARAAFLAQTPESFDYDDDGSLTQDGQWDYKWDAENRLIEAVTRPAVAQASGLPRQRLTFAYDAQSRRIRKTIESWNTALNSGAGDWVETLDLFFLYDGWNLLTELDANADNALVRSHAWGLDISGTPQRAGGVGGLLWTNTPTHTFAPSADANGNIVAYINTATLAVAGRADYGAFGEVVMQTGVAKELPFGFSTKYTDRETGLLYYGFRYYAPSTGRWPSRDPIGEEGGVNLYGMCNNAPTNYIDVRGNNPVNTAQIIIGAAYLSGDVAGAIILNQYLSGAGNLVIKDSPAWTSYLTRAPDMYAQAAASLNDFIISNGIKGSDHGKEWAYGHTFGVRLNNSSTPLATGYFLINQASVRVAGRLRIGSDCKLTGELIYALTDLINPNVDANTFNTNKAQFYFDAAFSTISEIATFGEARSYNLSITWKTTISMSPFGSSKSFSVSNLGENTGWPAQKSD